MKRIIVVLMLIFAFTLISAERISREEIFEKHVWKQLHEEYSPDPVFLDTLKSKTSDLMSVNIYLAFWCGDSENNVPPFMKILDAIGLTGERVNYFVVDRKKPGDEFYYKELKIERIPAFIIFKDGKEIGRIIENPKKSLEEDLLEILF